MKLAKPVFFVALIFLLTSPSSTYAQRRRGPRRTAPTPPATTPTPQPTPTPVVPPRQPKAPVALAIVNGQTITTADLDPRIRAEIDALDDKIAQARSDMVDVALNTILLELEARKRKLTTQQLYNVEVSRRVVEPTAAEITRFIEDNRGQVEVGDDDASRKQVAELLRARRAAMQQEEFVRRLRKLNPVVMGVDINSPTVTPTSVLVTIAGQPLAAAPLLEKLKVPIFKLRMDTYELERAAVARLIADTLVLAEAQRRNVAPEVLLRTEVSEKAHRPSDAEVEKFYTENRKEIRGELSAVQNQLAEFLEERDKQRLERELNERLMKSANVRWLMQEPAAPKLLISVDDDPSRGPVNAPVTIVEFTDFQCPACGGMHPILETVLQSYGNKVRFVVRDFPLPIHEHARKAAEAANAAHAQGKFFEYAALLFKNQNALDVPSLKKYASELGLDRARFDAALDKGTYAEEVQRDLMAGEEYGVDQTPTIYVNGVVLGTLSEEALRAAIEKALKP